MASAVRASNLMRTMAGASCRCPAHGHDSVMGSRIPVRAAGHTGNTDYAVEMACSNIRFGEGVTQVSSRIC